MDFVTRRLVNVVSSYLLFITNLTVSPKFSIDFLACSDKNGTSCSEQGTDKCAVDNELCICKDGYFGDYCEQGKSKLSILTFL